MLTFTPCWAAMQLVSTLFPSLFMKLCMNNEGRGERVAVNAVAIGTVIGTDGETDEESG
jgi:hypothetical protein